MRLFPGFWSALKSTGLLEFRRLHLKANRTVYMSLQTKTHMNRIDLAEEVECRLSMEDEETAEHVLCTYPADTRAIHSIIRKLIQQPKDLMDISLKRLIDTELKFKICNCYCK